MYYVYIMQSQVNYDRFYTGITDDLRHRIKQHNAGKVKHSSKLTPWKIKTYIAFDNKQRVFDFEKYLKSGSGRRLLRSGCSQL